LYNIGEASKETLGPSWEADPDFVRSSSLFVLFEKMDISLKTLTTKRVEKRKQAPFFSEEEAFCIILRLARAAAHLGKHKVIHRDLKPDNILLAGFSSDNAESPYVVKLADFGEALDCVTDGTGDLKMAYPNRQTHRGGSAFYLPPEVMCARPGDGISIDYSKSDIFSVGMSAHFFLSGESRPFDADNSTSFSVDNYKHLPKCYSDNIQEIVWRMINPKYSERCTAAEAVSFCEDILATTLNQAAG